MAQSDERVKKGWDKLAAAARKDGRKDPRTYFNLNLAPKLIKEKIKASTPEALECNP
ncbi:hypothetical protein KUIN1_01000 [Pseudomonas sp. KUIN-1]|nr:hypothetical protein KUIN1_01000 [Pseudomonas sp. KUIN-1]